MSFVDAQGGAEFDWPKDEVFAALQHAIPTIKGMSVAQVDDAIDRQVQPRLFA